MCGQSRPRRNGRSGRRISVSFPRLNKRVLRTAVLPTPHSPSMALFLRLAGPLSRELPSGAAGSGLDLLAGAALPVEVGDLQKTWPSSQVPEPRNQTPSPRFRQLHLVELKGTFVGLARCSRRLLGDSSRSWAGGGLPWSQEEAEPLCHGGHRQTRWVASTRHGLGVKMWWGQQGARAGSVSWGV